MGRGRKGKKDPPRNQGRREPVGRKESDVRDTEDCQWKKVPKKVDAIREGGTRGKKEWNEKANDPFPAERTGRPKGNNPSPRQKSRILSRSRGKLRKQGPGPGLRSRRDWKEKTSRGGVIGVREKKNREYLTFILEKRKT